MSASTPDCDRANTLLLDYAYGELEGEPRVELEKHLPGCARCRTDLDALRTTRRVMGSLEAEAAPERGLESLLAYAEQQAARQVAPKRPRWLTWAMAFVPAGLALSLGMMIIRQAKVSAPSSAVQTTEALSPTYEVAPPPAAQLAARVEAKAELKKESEPAEPMPGPAPAPVVVAAAPAMEPAPARPADAVERSEAKPQMGRLAANEVAKDVEAPHRKQKTAPAEPDMALGHGLADDLGAPGGGVAGARAAQGASGPLARGQGETDSLGGAGNQTRFKAGEGAPPPPAKELQDGKGYAARQDAPVGDKAEAGADEQVREAKAEKKVVAHAAPPAPKPAEAPPAPREMEVAQAEEAASVAAAPAPAAASAPMPPPMPTRAKVAATEDRRVAGGATTKADQDLDGWSQAQQLAQAQGHSEAARRFRALFEAAPNGPRAAEALLRAGEEEGAAGQGAQAIATLQEVARRFPNSAQAAQAMSEAAGWARNLGDEALAQQLESNLVSRYPSSSYAARARSQLRQVPTGAVAAPKAPAAAAPTRDYEDAAKASNTEMSR
jgi:TolA-binding protein